MFYLRGWYVGDHHLHWVQNSHHPTVGEQRCTISWMLGNILSSQNESDRANVSQSIFQTLIGWIWPMVSESLTLCTYLVAVWLSSSLTHDSSMSGCNTVWAIVTPTYTETIVMFGNFLPKDICLPSCMCYTVESHSSEHIETRGCSNDWNVWITEVWQRVPMWC